MKTLESQAGTEVQKELLESLKNIRASLAESLANYKQGGAQTGSKGNNNNTQMYKQLLSLRNNLAEDIKKHQQLEDQLNRRDERIIHLRKNFKRIIEVSYNRFE